MYDTRNDLPESTRASSIELLDDTLACAIDLELQARQAHWNVKGTEFFSLHELFHKVAEQVESYVDTLAERIVQLGGIADGTVQAVSKRTTLRPYPLSISDGRDHMEALAGALAAF